MAVRFADVSTLPDDYVVQLRCATLPSVLRPIAVHYWFTAFDPRVGAWQRWEVWQHRDAGGTSWGHVHLDLMRPDRPVGGGPCCVEAEWRGRAAQRLCAVLRLSPRYRYRNLYRYWPGPNSNTYVAWVLREAGICFDLDPRAIGKDYVDFGRFRQSARGRDIQWETPVAGLKLQRGGGAELHFLGLTVGWSAPPLCLKTPLGRWRPTDSARRHFRAIRSDPFRRR
jgi:hypothetical protein